MSVGWEQGSAVPLSGRSTHSAGGTRSLQQLSTANRKGQGLLALAFSPDGTRVVSGDEAGNVTLWDVSGPWLKIEWLGV